MLEDRHGGADEEAEVALGVGRAQVEAVDGALRVPVADECGQFHGVGGGVQFHRDRAEHPQPFGVPAVRAGPVAQLLAGGPRGQWVLGTDERDVGVAYGGGPRPRGGRVDDRDRVALGRSRHDGGAAHRERTPLEVDVVQFVAVNEAACRLVADLGVVLP